MQSREGVRVYVILVSNSGVGVLKRAGSEQGRREREVCGGFKSVVRGRKCETGGRWYVEASWVGQRTWCRLKEDARCARSGKM